MGGLIAGVGGWMVCLADGWVDGCLANWLSQFLLCCINATSDITIDVYLTHLSV